VTRTTPNLYRPLWFPDLISLVALGLLSTLPFLWSNLDIRLQHVFYHQGENPVWFAEYWKLWRMFYTFGPWPAFAAGLGALGFLLWSLRRPSWVRWRRHALLVILTLALGPGLLVNVVFKDHWGRPRPRQTTEFGGRWTYHPLLEKGLSGRGKSFPCGHSSAGYFFFVFYFILRRRRRFLSITVALATIIFGTLIGLARMAAGAHFASDVLWSALIPAVVAFLLYYVILRIPQHEDNPDQTVAGARPLWLLLGVPVVGLALLISAVAGTPAFRDLDYSLPLSAPSTGMEMTCEGCDMELVFDPMVSNRVTIIGHAQGFGWPWSDLRHHAAIIETNGLRQVQFSFRREGYFSEMSGRISVRVPCDFSGPVRIALQDGDLLLTVPEDTRLPPTEFTIANGTLVTPSSRQSKTTSRTTPTGATIYRLSSAP
jgi:lipid A 4'-phosphatase